MLSVNDVEPARKRPRWSTRGEIDGSSLEQRPIDIPAQSVFVKYFVELVTQAPLSPKKVDSLLPKHHRFHNRPIRRMKFMEEELLDRFDCTPAMYDRLHLHFEPEYRSHSWAVFLIAAKHKDVEMARKAIQHLRWLQGEKKVDPNTMPLADAESIPLSWFLGYSRAYASAMEDHPDVSHSLTHWSQTMIHADTV